MNLRELETPCLVLDREKLTRNITGLHARLKPLGVDLRPHGKTAKNIDVVRLALSGQAGNRDPARCISCNGCFKPGLEEGGIYCIVAKKEAEKAARSSAD